jgi:hypothetical protein
MYDIVGKIGNEYVVKMHKGLKRVKIKASDNKGIGDDYYIVKTHKGLKKVKISGTDKENINDEIKIEKL